MEDLIASQTESQQFLVLESHPIGLPRHEKSLTTFQRLIKIDKNPNAQAPSRANVILCYRHLLHMSKRGLDLGPNPPIHTIKWHIVHLNPYRRMGEGQL
jgi:hypothetical protein